MLHFLSGGTKWESKLKMSLEQFVILLEKGREAGLEHSVLSEEYWRDTFGLPGLPGPVAWGRQEQWAAGNP